MKTVRFASKEEWLNYRLGRLTGSEVKSTITTRGDELKSNVYALAGESLTNSAAINDDENPMMRGLRLEPIAMERFRKESGKKVDSDLLMWVRDDDERIAISPDGVIGKTEAVEIKCLSIAKHTEALYTRKIPKNTAGYEEQAAHYFIVSDQLKKLHYVFFNPDFPAPLDYLHLTFTRKEMQEEIENIRQAEAIAVARAREIITTLTFYSPEEVAKSAKVHGELLDEHKSDLERIHADIKERSLSV